MCFYQIDISFARARRVESSDSKRLETRRDEILSEHVDLTASCSSRRYKFKMHPHLCEEVGQQSPYLSLI